jgi:hypothetical protein
MKKILITSIFFIVISTTQAHDVYKPISHASFAAKPRACANTNEPKHSFAYGNVGAYDAFCLLPDCGIGYRGQTKRLGYDISFTLTPGFIFNILKVTPAALIYFHPNLESEWYIGLCCGLGVIIPSTKSFIHDTLFIVHPAFIVGKQYKNAAGKDRFIDVRIGEVISPSQHSHYFKDYKLPSHTPLLFSVNFGFGF